MNLHPGKIALACAAASIAVSAWLYTEPRLPEDIPIGRNPVQGAMTAMPIDAAAIREVERLEPHLENLGIPPAAGPWSLDLALLGYEEIKPLPVPPLPPPVVVVEPATPPAPAPFDYAVSMTYVSSDQRFAVINGRFYREGAFMPDGELVVTISPSAVQIQRDDDTRWVEIRREPDSITEGNGIPDSGALQQRRWYESRNDASRQSGGRDDS